MRPGRPATEGIRWVAVPTADFVSKGYAPRQACNLVDAHDFWAENGLKGLCAQAGLQQRDSQTLGAQGLAEASALTKHLCEKSPLSQAPNRAQSGYS